jgi:signal transduction histidine kinase
VQKSLGHDLRTPLGTIANYAAVLERNPATGADEVQRIAQRIHANAMDAATMLSLTLDALRIAARPPSPSQFDAAALLKKVATELAHGVQIVGDGRAAEDGAFQFDPDLVACVWKTFLAFARVESPAFAGKAWLARSDEVERSLLVLCLGRADPGAPAVTLEEFFSHAPSDSTLVRSFGLALCRELVTTHGGTLELAGRAGAEVVLRLAFPSNCAN